MVAYHAMMARLHLTFAKQQALLSTMATPAAHNGQAQQRDPNVVSDRRRTAAVDIACFSAVPGFAVACTALIGSKDALYRHPTLH